MNIRLSTPDLYFDKRIEQAAVTAGCYARIRWAEPSEVRFVLVDRAMSDKPATFEQHDQVIKALLELDPQARVRTARVTYEGLPDFEAQLKARVPA